MGEARKDALRISLDRAIKLEFHGAKVSSDAGLFPYRDLDDAAGNEPFEDKDNHTCDAFRYLINTNPTYSKPTVKMRSYAR